MKFKMIHENYNVLDLDRSLKFYDFEMELTWLRDRTEPYDLGDEEFHLAFRTNDYAAAHAKHEAMGCICFENPAMGIYFIQDPDGYWLEILPEK